jgi:hypothetical protein
MNRKFKHKIQEDREWGSAEEFASPQVDLRTLERSSLLRSSAPLPVASDLGPRVPEAGLCQLGRTNP